MYIYLWLYYVYMSVDAHELFYWVSLIYWVYVYLHMYVTWLIHISDMTHSYVWHDSFSYVTRLTHTNPPTDWAQCNGFKCICTCVRCKYILGVFAIFDMFVDTHWTPAEWTESMRYMCVCMWVKIYMCTDISVYTCMCAYMYIHIHECIHIQSYMYK